MKLINKDNKIFSSLEYQKDNYKFYLISLNLQNESVMLYSDEENYVICRGAVGYPTWVWTKDNFDISKLEEIKMAIDLYLTDNEKDKFTCKKELYDLLLSTGYDKLNCKDYFEMGFLVCTTPKLPKNTDGKMDKILEDEVGIIAEYWYNSCIETADIDMEPITMEEAAEDAKEMYDSGNLYVWRNNLGKIVSMGFYKVVDGQAKVSHVYTPIEERGKSYAANLIYNMTIEILNQDLVPLLYTDYNYIPSNKAYINVGYEDKGILINFTCSKEKNNKLKR